MSRLSDLQSKIHSLGEIQSILGAMKNLAIIEMNKVSKLMSSQTKISKTIDSALADFEFFYPNTARHSNGHILCLMIGSERGFCGPFNEQVIKSYRESKEIGQNTKVVLIGRKLAMKLGNDPRVEVRLEGPNSADEISAVVNELAVKLLPYANHRWMFIHSDGSRQGELRGVSFPLESRTPPSLKPFTYPPLLNMRPEELYPQLLEQHLFSIMHRALYTSFMAENRERLHHMEGALNQIEKDRGQFLLKLNSQRQEAITEELEILMLSSLCETNKENL